MHRFYIKTFLPILLTITLGLGLSVSLVVNDRQVAALHREMTQKVQAFGLEHFEEIDADRSGTITNSELMQSLESLRLNDE